MVAVYRDCEEAAKSGKKFSYGELESLSWNLWHLCLQDGYIAPTTPLPLPNGISVRAFGPSYADLSQCFAPTRPSSTPFPPCPTTSAP
jgi:hypothetical protein